MKKKLPAGSGELTCSGKYLPFSEKIPVYLFIKI
jgi:hypothetical protein